MGFLCLFPVREMPRPAAKLVLDKLTFLCMGVKERGQPVDRPRRCAGNRAYWVASRNRIRIVATCALVAGPWGLRVVVLVPEMRPVLTAQVMASTA